MLETRNILYWYCSCIDVVSVFLLWCTTVGHKQKQTGSKAGEQPTPQTVMVKERPSRGGRGHGHGRVRGTNIKRMDNAGKF